MFVIIISNLGYSQDTSSVKGRFGVVVNTSIDGVIGEWSFAPTGLFYYNKHQIELGLCIYPFNFSTPRMIGGALSYKYFPNGISNRFNMFLSADFNLTNEFSPKHIYYNNYERTYNYFSILGGYGFEVKFLKNAFIGTSFNFGINFNSLITDDPSIDYDRKLFEEYELDGAFRFNIGYRF